jgi:hypothetical protein
MIEKNQVDLVSSWQIINKYNCFHQIIDESLNGNGVL